MNAASPQPIRWLLIGIFWISMPMEAQKPFKATAQLGVPAQIGSIARVSGSNEILEIGLRRELTLDSAELALTFPNRVENIIAKADEKLLILRGSLRNPEKTSSVMLGPSAVIGLRLWQRYEGTGKFQFVAHFDPDTLRHIQKNLKGGESGKFVGVWRIPSDFRDFRLGMSSDLRNIVPWYDLNSSIGRLQSIFAAPDGISVNPSATVRAGANFSIDGLDITVPSVTSRPKQLYVVNIRVTNGQMLPVRWGWQYVTAELLGADGSVTKAYPDIIDQATGKSWAGDLPASETVNSQLLFYPSAPTQPQALRITFIATGRSITVGL